MENDTYDKAGRLTSQTVKRGKEEISSYSYTYDVAGNIVSSTGTGADGAGVLTGAEMTYDKQNRLLTYNGKEIKYDKCGNMTYGPVDGKMTKLAYDCRNRLVSAGGVSYGYDAENNRTYAKTKEYTEEYVTDTVSSELSRVIMVIRSDRETRKLTYGNGLISEKIGNEVMYHHYNNIGSTMMLTDGNGAVKAEYTYGTYGELLSGDGTLSRYLYNGKYGVSTDANGLYYMRQRYYNTEIKRFINQDIVVGSISNSQSLNRYSYVQGNPVTLTDPFGLSPLSQDTIMGVIHGILDVAGCVPGKIGIIANLTNAALYAFVDHDYGMAALSLLAGVTLGAAKIATMGGKMAKAVNTVATVGRFISNVASFAMCTLQAVDVGAAMWQKYYVEGKPLDGGSAMEFLTLGLNVAGMAMSGKGMVESGNKICKSIKESGVTNKVSGKVKYWAKRAWNSNRGGPSLICKSIKESGVTNKVSGKVKYWAKKAWNSNGGFVDPSAPIVIGGSKTDELVLKGVEYSPDYAQKLKDTYKIFKSNGYEISEHGLNRILGRINQGKIGSVEEVLDVIKNGTKYVDTVNGGTVLYKNRISIHIADDGFIKTVIGNAKIKSTWEVVS